MIESPPLDAATNGEGERKEHQKTVLNKRLGSILLATELITEGQLQQALKAQREQRGRKLGEILVELGFISQTMLSRALAQQFNMPFVNLDDVTIEPAAVSVLNEELARKHQVLPVKLEDGVLTVAISDPLDINGLDRLRSSVSYAIREVVAHPQSIAAGIGTYYAGQRNLSEMIDRIAERVEQNGAEGEEEGDLYASEESVTGFVRHFLTTAAHRRSSDVHVVPGRQRVEVTFRIDGALHQHLVFARELQPMVVARIKVLADMDITEHRLPQDGRARVNFDGRLCDLRISTIPTVHGESVAIRILEKTAALRTLETLGFEGKDLQAFRQVFTRPFGMVLVTGPTGSGKSTTLYAALNEIKSEAPPPRIITVEDPVEYEIDGINQIQTKHKIGYTFSTALRHIVRHDPDVIMVGEIRDVETAKLAVQSALTGHRVFSTFHTNDAAGALTRLLDMEVEPFLVADSVLAVLGQRLVRSICSKCKEAYTPTDELAHLMGAQPGPEGKPVLWQGKGCRHCNRTGYQGRSSVYELLLVNDEIRELVLARESSDTIRGAAIACGMRTMLVNLLDKVRTGTTTAEEALRLGLFDTTY